MIHNPSYTERLHRAISEESAPVKLMSKRCACGKAAPAKQLAQYGVCVACQLDARIASLQPGDIEKLRHALGASTQRPKSGWGFRNYYCAALGGANDAAMRRMVVAGFMAAGHEGDKQAYFHATKDGCKLAGLNAAGIRRALEDLS